FIALTRCPDVSDHLGTERLTATGHESHVPLIEQNIPSPGGRGSMWDSSGSVPVYVPIYATSIEKINQSDCHLELF
ncbi:MAG: hypothetical protein WBO37_10450, partial [Gammaproteobacteria bacterium]